MLLWLIGVGFENTCTVSRKSNEDAGLVLSSFGFVFGVNQEN